MEKEDFLRQYRREELQRIELPRRLEEEFTLLACLKHSEQRQIYLVQAKESGIRYLLKCSSLPPKEDLLAEYSMLSTLQAPEFPKAVDYLEEDGKSWLVRQYCEGHTLCELVERSGPFAEDRAVAVILKVCAALRLLHMRTPPVVHRDIKPQNIILTSEGECRLIDLGTARLYKPENSLDTVFAGTPLTAAPEQFGYRQTDVRADIYGMGILLTYLLTGEYDISTKALKGISSPLRRVLQRCVEFAPKRRFPNIAALSARLRLVCNLKKYYRRAAAVFGALVLLAAGGIIWQLAAMPLPQQPVAFREPLIEQAVRQELGKSKSSPITIAELEQVEQLLLCGERSYESWEAHRQYAGEHYLSNERIYSYGGITSLEDLRGMKNLRLLSLDNQKITSLAPLRELPLRRVSLCGNQITDLSPLKGCERLAELRVENNPIADVEALTGLKELTVLDIGYSAVNSIAPLTGLNLEELYLLGAPITDYSYLSELAGLRLLAVRDLPPKGLAVVRELTALHELTVYNSGIDSPGDFAKLKNLRRLDVFANDVRNLAGVERLASLTELCVGDNPVRSLEPLTNMETLTILEIHRIENLSDYTPLLRINGLRELHCTAKQAQEIRTAFGEPPFEIKIFE